MIRRWTRKELSLFYASLHTKDWRHAELFSNHLSLLLSSLLRCCSDWFNHWCLVSTVSLLSPLTSDFRSATSLYLVSYFLFNVFKCFVIHPFQVSSIAPKLKRNPYIFLVFDIVEPSRTRQVKSVILVFCRLTLFIRVCILVVFTYTFI